MVSKMTGRDLNLYKEKYLNNCGFEQKQVEYRRNNLLKYMRTYSPGKILEIGCGTESVASHYVDFTDFTVVEPIKEFFDIAREKLGEKVHCINNKFEDCIEELRTKDFDFIIISSLIHELDRPQDILQGVCNLAGAETIVHINTPNAKSIHRLLGVKMGIIRHTGELSDLARSFQRRHEYELPDIERLANESGFKILDKGSYFLKPLSHEQMQTLLESGKISKEFLDAIYDISRILPENGSEIFVNMKLKEA